jgi:hypothetical protein
VQDPTFRLPGSVVTIPAVEALRLCHELRHERTLADLARSAADLIEAATRAAPNVVVELIPGEDEVVLWAVARRLRGGSLQPALVRLRRALESAVADAA